MGPKNLILTKVELTDKPYEVQLDVLRWIKQLVSALVDTAVPCDDQGHQAPVALAASKQTATDSVSGAAEDGKTDHASVCFKENYAEVGAGSNVDGNADNTNTTGSSSCHDERASVQGGEGGVAQQAQGDGDSRRKRARTLSQQAKHEHAVGSVVECFHAVRLHGRRYLGVVYCMQYVRCCIGSTD